MNREQAREQLQGTPVTLLTPFDDDYRLDLARMADMTRWWVDQGLGTKTAALKVSAAMGEGPDLSDDEWPHLLRTVVNAAGSDATVICGLKPKNTLHTIDDAKRAQDLGAAALQIDLPFFHHARQDDNVRHFTAISDAIDIGIMIYNTHWFCLNPAKEYVNAETMLRLRDTEHVVAIKWSVPAGEDYDQMRQFSEFFNVIDNSRQPVKCHQNGGRGYISWLIAVHPQHDLEVWRLIEAGSYDEAQARLDRVNAALAPWQAKTTEKSGGYRQGKGMLAARGLPIGPPRPPTLPLDDAEIAEVRAIMEQIGWLEPVPAM